MFEEIFIDIETLPDPTEGAMKRAADKVSPPHQMKKQETIDKWMNGEKPYEGVRDNLIQEQYRKTALSGDRGRILCISTCMNGKLQTYYAERFSDEKGMLKQFWQDMADVSKSSSGRIHNPYFIAHNAEFDLEFLWKRSIIHGVEPLIYRNGRHGKNHFCTMREWSGYNGRISLDDLANILGVGNKTPGMDGSKVFDYWKNDLHDEIKSYCEDDVVLVEKIYNRITGN